MEAGKERLEQRSPDRCPFCRDALTESKPVVACAACGARQHEICHQEHGACSACGATDVLIRPPTSPARARREQPPRGSTITVEVEEADAAVTYSWPRFRNRPAVLALMIALTATVLLSPVALLIFLSWWKDEPLSIRLEPKRLRLITAPSGVLGRREDLVLRRDVGAILLDRSMGYMRLTIDVGVERLPVASVATLKEPELEWLHEALLAWKAEA